MNPTQQHGTIPAAEGRWHDGRNEPSGVGDSDPGGKAQGSLRPAGGHPENLPRTRRDHAGATRQESARPDREDGIRGDKLEMTLEFAETLLWQKNYRYLLI